jgi:hypothetical protein
MKLLISMKTPDAVICAATDYARRELEASGQADADDAAEQLENLTEEGKELLSRWFTHGEYVRLEVDTDAGTCVVLERYRR